MQHTGHLEALECLRHISSSLTRNETVHIARPTKQDFAPALSVGTRYVPICLENGATSFRQHIVSCDFVLIIIRVHGTSIWFLHEKETIRQDPTHKSGLRTRRRHEGVVYAF